MPRERSQGIDDRIRIQHMIDAGRQVAQFISGRTRADLDRDPMLSRAVLHALLEIGEAAARISDAGRARVTGVPWGTVVGMRHILVHVYWGVDLNRVWTTVTVEAPDLVQRLEAAVVDWPMPPSTLPPG